MLLEWPDWKELNLKFSENNEEFKYCYNNTTLIFSFQMLEAEQLD